LARGLGEMSIGLLLMAGAERLGAEVSESLTGVGGRVIVGAEGCKGSPISLH